MLIRKVYYTIALCAAVKAVHYPSNPASDAEELPPSTDHTSNKTSDVSEQDDTEHELEIEKSAEEVKDKGFLDDALKTVLGPESIITNKSEVQDGAKTIIEGIVAANQTLDTFMDNMDKLSLDVCKNSQDALWSYITDNLNQDKKKQMIYDTSQEDEVKKKYWDILESQYLDGIKLDEDPILRRKLRIIKERAINVLIPNRQEQAVVVRMQRAWSNAMVCAYNSSCGPRDVLTLSDIISIFKTSNDSEELRYYWKAFRVATGSKIRPFFKEYVSRMNNIAKAANFTDLGDLWRFSFEDDNFVETVNRLWSEVRPLYNLLQKYVRAKLMKYYSDDIKGVNDTIPAHLLGNLWAQNWQSIYHLVTPYPDHPIPTGEKKSSEVFKNVDEYFQSLGFQTSAEAFSAVSNVQPSAGCLPSSHDMCNGEHRIKWCAESESAIHSLSRAAQLLGRVQYARHYGRLPLVFRAGPTPAFAEAVSNLAATQVTSPEQMKRFGLLTNLTPELSINHLLWLALEKLPLMGYSYVLDTWRWDVFGGVENWNEHWWNLRMNETGISAPVARNESDLDPASKYHVVAHVQYITYLISQVMEFQMLLALCRAANHTGPLHQCSLHGSQAAGNLLSNGMSLGASEDWRTVLQTMTEETEMSTKGILQYFKPLEEFLEKENLKLAQLDGDMGLNIPILVGVIIVIITIAIVIAYCVREKGLGSKISGAMGMAQNGSLDIASEMSGETNPKVSNIPETIKEEKL